MKKQYDILTIFDSCVDVVFTGSDLTPEFSQKEKLVEDYFVELGGSAGIFACQAAKLGLKTTGVGVVGNDAFGELLLKKMAASGIDNSFMKVSDEMKTGAGVALIKGDDRAILTYTGTIDVVTPDMITDEILRRTRHLHIASYFLTTKITPYYPDILKRAKSFDVTVSLDTNWDPGETWDDGILDIMPYVDIFMPNENEIRYIANKETLDEAVTFFRGIVPVIALKLGKDGARVITKDSDCSRMPIPAIVADTVGAGDSFDAGFLYGYLNGMDLRTCLDIATFCGHGNVTRHGGIAGQPLKKDVLEFIEQ